MRLMSNKITLLMIYPEKREKKKMIKENARIGSVLHRVIWIFWWTLFSNILIDKYASGFLTNDTAYSKEPSECQHCYIKSAEKIHMRDVLYGSSRYQALCHFSKRKNSGKEEETSHCESTISKAIWTLKLQHTLSFLLKTL